TPEGIGVIVDGSGSATMWHQTFGDMSRNGMKMLASKVNVPDFGVAERLHLTLRVERARLRAEAPIGLRILEEEWRDKDMSLTNLKWGKAANSFVKLLVGNRSSQSLWMFKVKEEQNVSGRYKALTSSDMLKFNKLKWQLPLMFEMKGRCSKEQVFGYLLIVEASTKLIWLKKPLEELDTANALCGHYLDRDYTWYSSCEESNVLHMGKAYSGLDK
ncbi:hypothetical protein Tco_1274723, partial [Tanacetum coccineum]